MSSVPVETKGAVIRWNKRSKEDGDRRSGMEKKEIPKKPPWREMNGNMTTNALLSECRDSARGTRRGHIPIGLVETLQNAEDLVIYIKCASRFFSASCRIPSNLIESEVHRAFPGAIRMEGFRDETDH